MVRLLDGSLVEMGERSELSVSRGLEGDNDSSGGRSGDCAGRQSNALAGSMLRRTTVSVKGTIFSVNRGTRARALR